MTRWKPDEKVFEVMVMRHPHRLTNTSCIPKPILDKLGDPDRIRFVIKGNKIIVTGPE